MGKQNIVKYISGIIKKFEKLVLNAESRLIDRIRSGRLEAEPDISASLGQTLEEIFLNNSNYEKIKFNVRAIRGIGNKASENFIGADMCMVLNIRLRGFQITKGLLLQAKRENTSDIHIRAKRGVTTVRFTYNAKFRKLVNQVDNMLEMTSSCFVIIYSENGFVVVPANSVIGIRKTCTVYAKPLSSFLKEYLMCFIGDSRVVKSDDRFLEILKTVYKEKDDEYNLLKESAYAKNYIIFQIYDD